MKCKKNKKIKINWFLRKTNHLGIIKYVNKSKYLIYFKHKNVKAKPEK
jgi:hypothetical protein